MAFAVFVYTPNPFGVGGMVGEKHSYRNVYQRAGVFAELPAILVSKGVDPLEVFDGSGLAISGLRYDSRIPMAVMLECLDRAAHRLKCPHLGLILGHRFTFDIHGPIGRLMQSAATLGGALMDFVTWQQGYSNSAVVYLNKVAGGAAFGYGAYIRSSPGTLQLYDAVMAVGCKMVSELTAGKVQPSDVLLSHRRPDDMRPYLRYLAGQVRFDQPQSCLLLNEAALATPLPRHDPAGRQRALSELEAIASKLMPSFAARVAHRLKPLIHEGEPRLDALARVLGTSPRTLSRRLREEGTSFETVRSEVRFAYACELLDMTELPIGDVSAALAYATHGAFDEAFRRWAGMTPSAWRARRGRVAP
jgi:AraC-like DNA-binding protein